MPAHVLFRLTALTLAALFCQACASGSGGTPVVGGLSKKGPHRLESKRNLLSNHMTRNQDGSINVVVEIPAGTSEKWEVSQDGMAIVRDFTGKTPRVIDYLPYPGNYGMIPRTLLDSEHGGDGSALDVLVLGPAVARGSVVRARAIGIIRVVDRMEQDDKILAVLSDSTLKSVTDIESLNSRYPGASEIVSTWFSNAHGKRSKVQLMGTGSRSQANAVIDFAIDSYRKESFKKKPSEELEKD